MLERSNNESDKCFDQLRQCQLIDQLCRMCRYVLEHITSYYSIVLSDFRWIVSMYSGVELVEEFSTQFVF